MTYIPGWTVQTMHQKCDACNECAANAVEHAEKTDGTSAQSSFQETHDGQPNTVAHAATVVKL